MPGGSRLRPGLVPPEAGGVRTDRRLRAFQIVEVDIFEARQQRHEALVHLFLVGRADRGHGPPVEGVLEGDDLELVIVAFVLVIGAHGLDRAFHRLRARIGEEHRIGKGQVDEPLRQVLTLRAPIEVRDMHQRLGLLLDRPDQARV